MGWIGLDPDTQWLISQVTEMALIALLFYWLKFEKKQSKRRPRKKKEVTVIVPTKVEVTERSNIDE